MSLIDLFIVSTVATVAVAFVYILWSYARGLWASPREIWLVAGARLLEAIAYFAISFALTLWLSSDCGLSDFQAGAFITILYVMKAVFGLFAGPFVDAFGIKRSLVFSLVLIIISRVFMFWVTSPILVMALVFLPVAVGVSFLEPAGLIALKRYTTPVSANLAFGMIYVIMNVAMAAGLWGFDEIRASFGEHAGATIPVLGHVSTYQLIFLLSLAPTFASFLLVWPMRDGVKLEADGIRRSVRTQQTGTFAEIIAESLKKGAYDISRSLASVVRQPFFWKYIFLIALTLFVRSTFFHLIYLFPKYGIRVLGEGAKVGTIYGVLNPFLIIFMVPFVAAMTRTISSYSMLICGTAISALSVFVAAVPGSVFSSLTDSPLGEIVFVRWLNLAPNMPALLSNPPSDFYWPLCFFIIIWSIGEATWYPRLIQFMTEIAPKGSEGTYIGLVGITSYLPNLLVGPLSGTLLEAYTPMRDVADATGGITQIVGDLSQHYMVWIWIGAIAVLTPVGLIMFRNVYYSMKEELSKAEQHPKAPA